MDNQERTEARNALGQDSISAVADPIAAMRKPFDNRYVQQCRDALAGAITSPEKMAILRRNTPLLGSVTPSVTCDAAVSAGSGMIDHAVLTFTTAEGFDYEPALSAHIKPKVTEAFRAGRAVAVITPRAKATLYGPREAIGKTLIVAGRKFTVVAVDYLSYSGTYADPGLAIPMEFYAPLAHRMNREEGAGFFGNDVGVYARPLDFRQYGRAAAQLHDALLPLLPAEYRKTIRFSERIPETTRQFIFQHKAVAMRGVVGALAVLLVALIGLANMLLVSVHDELRETGLRRALGATRPDVFLHFLSQGILLSALGAIAGLAIGAGVVGATRSWAGLPLSVSAFWAAAGAVATVLAGALTSAAPALIATRIHPVEALRYE